MSTQTIREALESRLASWAATPSPALPIAWENAAFSPTGGIYLRVALLPAATAGLDLRGAHRTLRGVFQIEIVCPINTGPGAAGVIADELDVLFPNNLRIAREGITVQVIAPVSIAPAIQEPSTYSVPVSVFYRADV